MRCRAWGLGFGVPQPVAGRSVYSVCMARVNIYLPDELAARAREKGLNVSAVTRAALEAELAGDAGSEWLAQAEALPSLDVEHDDALTALDHAREEFSGLRRG